MPTFTPLLDALKSEKSAQRDKEAIQRSRPHYKDATRASKEAKCKKEACTASDATSEAKYGGDLTAPLGKRAAKGSATAHFRCSTCGQAISVLSEQGQVQARQCKVDFTLHVRNGSDPTLPTHLQIRFSSRRPPLLLQVPCSHDIA